MSSGHTRLPKPQGGGCEGLKVVTAGCMGSQTDGRTGRAPRSGELERVATSPTVPSGDCGRCVHGGQDAAQGPCRKATHSQPRGGREADFSREGQDTGWAQAVGSGGRLPLITGRAGFALPHGCAVSIAGARDPGLTLTKVCGEADSNSPSRGFAMLSFVNIPP